MDTTPISLLERVRKGWDQDAWGRFVQLYSPLIFDWARRCGLQPADCADLTQDVFTTLFQQLPHFTYDRHKSFRAWLRTVTLNHWRDQQRRIATRPLPQGEDALAAAADDELAELDEAEYRRHLVRRALQIMQSDFPPVTWQAFWEHRVLGRPAAEVAAEYGMTPGTVYGATFRVLARLRQELLGLFD
jgi:RNA polymerase sigma-70 factor (ECF subfamily)